MSLIPPLDWIGHSLSFPFLALNRIDWLVWLILDFAPSLSGEGGIQGHPTLPVKKFRSLIAFLWMDSLTGFLPLRCLAIPPLQSLGRMGWMCPNFYSVPTRACDPGTVNSASHAAPSANSLPFHGASIPFPLLSLRCIY